MAIKENNQPNNAMQDAMQDAQARAPQFDAARAASEQQQGLRGMAFINSVISRPMSRTGVGEQLTAYLEALREVVRKELLNDADRYVFLPIDRTTYELPVNVIVVAQHVRYDKGPVVMVYPILLEPAEGLPSRFQTFGANEYEIPTTMSDAYDARVWQAIQSVVRNHFKLPNVNVDDVTFNIIRNQLPPTDEKRIARLAALAINPIAGDAKELPGHEEARFIAQLICGPENARTGAQLFGRMDFNPPAKESVTGMPVRTDIAISTKLVMPNQNSGAAAAPSAPILTQIGGYLDLMYIEPEMMPSPQGFGQMIKSTNAYQARFVMTGIDVETNGVTPELALLALASSYMLNNNNAWVNAYKKRHGVENDTRDIGAIGYEIPVDANNTQAKIDTGASDFNLYQFISRFFRQGLVFSIDVDQGGDDSWVWNTLQYAAGGDVAAIENFILTADNLTNNHFSKLWDRKQPLAKHSGNVITLGYFNSGATKEDLRKIDYLAQLNLFGADDLNTVVEFANTFDPTQGDPAVRLGERTRNIRVRRP